MNGDDMRFPQPRGDVRFTLEPLEVLPVTRKRFGQELESDKPVTLRVIRLINFPHPAGAQQTLEAIVSNLP